MNQYLADLLKRHPALNECVSDIEETFVILRNCYREGNKVLICGNGGSAADAEHWSAELMKGFYQRRQLQGEIADKLSPELAGNLQGALPTIPLSGFTSLSTAFANDCDVEFLMAQLVLGLGQPGDVLVGISTSGNSRNILLAIETAEAVGMKTVGLTGMKGGKMHKKASVCIRVPAKDVHLIQEYHMPVYHTLSLMLEDEFFGVSE